MKNEPNYDWRDIRHGNIIPSEQYTDQPYIIKTDDGAWLCTLTTGCAHEGQKGQHVITYRSLDKGKTWQDYNELETGEGPESAYSVLLKIPSGRIFAFYNYNSQNIREVPADPGPTFNGKCWRVDCLGDFVFRYSDDNGISWSKKRYLINVREMQIDRDNCFGGKIRFFWNVGKAFFHDNCAFVPLIKIGGFGEGCYTRTEGVLLKCANINSAEPDNLSWETLPDGESGLKTPPDGGIIAEEQSYSVLSDGTFFCVYRSIDGHPVYSYSRDGGHSWSQPEYMRYADGRLMKHPRAANFAWKCNNGKFLYWFHNHGGKDFDNRNPAWICGGLEADSAKGKIIKWSQPEIMLYDKDPLIAMSYPDLIEDEGLYISETQKKIARTHKISSNFLEKLWKQFSPVEKTKNNLLLEINTPEIYPILVDMPELPEFILKNHNFDKLGSEDLNTGFTIEFISDGSNLSPNLNLLDSRTANGTGLSVITDSCGNLKIVLSDGLTENHWSSDPKTFSGDGKHHAVIIVDSGCKTISFVIDGKFNDGGSFRQFGWGRFSPALKHANGSGQLKISKQVKKLRIYSRALMTSEAIGNYQAEIRISETEKAELKNKDLEPALSK
jgi:hypothetical protein